MARASAVSVHLAGSLVAASIATCASHDDNIVSATAPAVGAVASAFSADVVVRPDARLAVTIRFSGAPSRALELDEGGERFVSGITLRSIVESGEGDVVPAEWDGAVLTTSCPGACELSYVYDLAAAAEGFDSRDEVAKIGKAFIASPSAWLLHPSESPVDATFDIGVKTEGGMDFAFGAARTKGRYTGHVRDLAEPPYAVMGELRRSEVGEGDRAMDVILVGREPDLGVDAALGWVREAMLNVRSVHPDYPRNRPLVIVIGTRGTEVGSGTAMGNSGQSIQVEIGQRASAEELRGDWVLTHEMLHLALPGLSRDHHWAEEGMATFLEPIARARRGVIPIDAVWREWLTSMHQGEPASGDAGLDETPTWGRTYWGGALFYLKAEVETRRATANARGMVDAFDGIFRAGDISDRWAMSKFLEVADGATGAREITKLYAEHAHAAVPIDLDQLFTELGVKLDGRDVVYSDAAPLAAIRRAIVTGPANTAPAPGPDSSALVNPPRAK